MPRGEKLSSTMVKFSIHSFLNSFVRYYSSFTCALRAEFSSVYFLLVSKERSLGEAIGMGQTATNRGFRVSWSLATAPTLKSITVGMFFFAGITVGMFFFAGITVGMLTQLAAYSYPPSDSKSNSVFVVFDNIT
jgi:hypothetical protein